MFDKKRIETRIDKDGFDFICFVSIDELLKHRHLTFEQQKKFIEELLKADVIDVGSYDQPIVFADNYLEYLLKLFREQRKGDGDWGTIEEVLQFEEFCISAMIDCVGLCNCTIPYYALGRDYYSDEGQNNFDQFVSNVYELSTYFAEIQSTLLRLAVEKQMKKRNLE